MAESTKQPSAVTPLVTKAVNKIAGRGRTYESKYRVGTATYPSDLFGNSNQYGDNYVVFYINVPESSKLITENRVTVTDRDTTEIGSTIKSASALLKTASDKLNEKTGLKLPTRQSKRITDTITLNVPNNLTTRYSVSWDAEDMMLGNAAADIINSLSNKNTSQSVETGVAAGANVAMSKLPGGSIAQAMSGVAPNPKKEQLFKNVDFRTFNFEYQFAPRDAEESRNVKKIIDLFKLHMHPEFKDASGFLFLYPSEFEIVYYQGSSENMNLPRHTSCVLIDMSINYTPQNAFNTFDDGSSTLITINLTFKELAILTKAEILDGF